MGDGELHVRLLSWSPPTSSIASPKRHQWRNDDNSAPSIIDGAQAASGSSVSSSPPCNFLRLPLFSGHHHQRPMSPRERRLRRRHHRTRHVCFYHGFTAIPLSLTLWCRYLHFVIVHALYLQTSFLVAIVRLLCRAYLIGYATMSTLTMAF